MISNFSVICIDKFIEIDIQRMAIFCDIEFVILIYCQAQQGLCIVDTAKYIQKLLILRHQKLAVFYQCPACHLFFFACHETYMYELLWSLQVA